MITRELKNYTFEFNEEAKTLRIENKVVGNVVVLDKIRMFSLFRFLIRISQRLSTKRRVVKHND